MEHIMAKPLKDIGLDKIFNYLLRQDEDTVRLYKNRSSPYIDLVHMHLLCLANAVDNVVEVGTFRGLSACFMALGVKGTVHTINKSAGEIEAAEKLARDLEITNIVFHHGDSLEVLAEILPGLSGKFQLGYIDGWHSYHYAMNEYRLIEQHLDKNKGLIVFDDAAKLHNEGKDDGGVPRVISELKLEPCRFLNRRVALKPYGEFKTLERRD